MDLFSKATIIGKEEVCSPHDMVHEGGRWILEIRDSATREIVTRVVVAAVKHMAMIDASLGPTGLCLHVSTCRPAKEAAE